MSNLQRGQLLSHNATLWYPVLSTSTFIEGDPVYFDSNGKLEQLISNAAFTSQVFAGSAITQAVNPDTNAVNAAAAVAVWQPDETRLALCLYSATPASAVFNPNMVGVTYGLIMTSGGFVAVNVDDTSNVKVKVLGPLEDDYPGWPTYNSAGTLQYARVVVTPLAAACKLSGVLS